MRYKLLCWLGVHDWDERGPWYGGAWAKRHCRRCLKEQQRTIITISGKGRDNAKKTDM